MTRSMGQFRSAMQQGPDIEEAWRLVGNNEARAVMERWARSGDRVFVVFAQDRNLSRGDARDAQRSSLGERP